MRTDKHLPELLLITPEPVADADGAFDTFVMRLDHALERGIALVQLRAKQLDAGRFDLLAARVLNQCRARGARLILNGPTSDAPGAYADADGLHLSSERLMQCSRRMVPEFKLLSAACHSEDQLAQAARVGADFVTLSPVLPTASHPGAPTLGWQRFGELLAHAQVPVYALGGMSPSHSEEARAMGAQGIAAISALW
jgi:thiamine-phosphate pyrophosphorylase